MNNLNDPTESNGLIDRAITDETWSDFDSRLRDRALHSFTTAKRRRRARRLAMQICAVLMLAAAAAFVSFRKNPSSKTEVVSNLSRPAASAAARSVITEQQMLEMFPPGSCLLAEVNGEKQLVFLDPKLASKGFPIAASQPACGAD